MVKRFQLALCAAALVVVGLLSTGCEWGGLGSGLGYSNAIDNLPRIITAILHEDLFS
jgi:hypothetical protein